MAWLHENKEEFKNAVLFAAEQNRIAPAAVHESRSNPPFLYQKTLQCEIRLFLTHPLNL